MSLCSIILEKCFYYIQPKTTSFKILQTPQTAPLPILLVFISHIKQGLLNFVLLLARAVIVHHWKSPISPTVAKWAREMCHPMRMENLTAQLHERQYMDLDSFKSYL